MPELAADAAGLLRALGRRERPRLRALDGRHDRPGAGDPLPRARARLVLGGTTPGGPRAVLPRRRAGRARRGRSRAGGALAGRALLARFRREHPERVRELLPYFARHRAPPRGAWAHWWATVYHDTVVAAGADPGADARAARRRGRDGAGRQRAAAGRRGSRTPSWRSSRRGPRVPLERPRSPTTRWPSWLDRRGPIAPGRAAAGVAARAEPLTRALGPADRRGADGSEPRRARRRTELRRRSAHVATDR